jgi:hypothetical protein
MAAAILLAGCIPEESLEWSDDGSVGLLCLDKSLHLVDGNSGQLTLIEPNNVLPLPGISQDGNYIIYCKPAQCESLSEALELIPPSQVKMIEGHARDMRDKVLASKFSDGNFHVVDGKEFKYVEPYRWWVIRYMCANADQKLKEKIGIENLKVNNATPLTYFKLIKSPTDNPLEEDIVATNAFGMLRPRFSPDGRHIAYLAIGPKNRHHLFIALADSPVESMLITKRTALGFDWRSDSRALVYFSGHGGEEEDSIICTLNEMVVADENAKLLASPVVGGFVATHSCNSKATKLAGTMFDSWMKVQYGPGGRLFFSSGVIGLPTSELDELKWSLFCYDPLTRTIADVLPQVISDQTGQQVKYFSISPDGTKSLLPMPENRFFIYELETAEGSAPVKKEEGFGDENTEFLPTWKGNNEISALVSGDYLNRVTSQTNQRKDIVLVGVDGKYRGKLSPDWPDEFVNSLAGQGSIKGTLN